MTGRHGAIGRQEIHAMRVNSMAIIASILPNGRATHKVHIPALEYWGSQAQLVVVIGARQTRVAPDERECHDGPAASERWRPCPV